MAFAGSDLFVLFLQIFAGLAQQITECGFGVAGPVAKTARKRAHPPNRHLQAASWFPP
jgi:hypothetical protein